MARPIIAPRLRRKALQVRAHSLCVVRSFGAAMVPARLSAATGQPRSQTLEQLIELPVIHA